MSLGAGQPWAKGWGLGVGVWTSWLLPLCSHSLLQKRKSMTKLRGPNPKSSRTTLQSKSVRRPLPDGGGWGSAVPGAVWQGPLMCHCPSQESEEDDEEDEDDEDEDEEEEDDENGDSSEDGGDSSESSSEDESEDGDEVGRTRHGGRGERGLASMAIW